MQTDGHESCEESGPPLDDPDRGNVVRQVLGVTWNVSADEIILDVSDIAQPGYMSVRLSRSDFPHHRLLQIVVSTTVRGGRGLG